MTTAKKAAPAANKTAAKKATPAKKATAPKGKTELDTNPGPEAPAVTDKDVASSDVQKAAEKQQAAVTAELGSAAERRANYLAALDEELDMCQRAGKTDRVEAIKAEIKRVKSTPTGRSEKPSDEA